MGLSFPSCLEMYRPSFQFFFLSNPSPLKVYSYIYGSVLEVDLQITDALFISLKFFLSNFILHSFYCYILTVLNIFICNIWYDIYTIQNFLPQILWFLHFKVWFFYFLIYFFILKCFLKIFIGVYLRKLDFDLFKISSMSLLFIIILTIVLMTSLIIQTSVSVLGLDWLFS